MKSFQYTAKDQQGQLVTGVIETDHFADASSKIQGRGLELISLEELRGQMQQFNSFIFEAVDIEGEAIQGTLTGADESEIRQRLQDELGYQVKNIQMKGGLAEMQGAPHVIHVAVKDDEAEKGKSSDLAEKRKESIDSAQKVIQQAPATKKEESIIFQRQPKMFFGKTTVTDEELDREQKKIELYLHEKGSILSQTTKERFHHLLSMISFVRENRNKKRWKNLKAELRKVEGIALDEVEQHEEMVWKKLEQQDPGKKVDSYQDLDERASLRAGQESPTLARFKKWARTVSEPDESKEGEVLIKQQYESVWGELQRFSGALLCFYMVVYLASYYLMRGGIEDHLLVRIYDTTLFKQLILGLFSLYGLLVIRNHFSKKKILSDLLFGAAWAVGIVVVFW